MFSKRLINKAIRQRFAVNLPGNEGAFTGVLVDHDATYWVFENCRTVPDKAGHTSEELPGRVWVKHAQAPAPYLQEVQL